MTAVAVSGALRRLLDGPSEVEAHKAAEIAPVFNVVVLDRLVRPAALQERCS